MQIKVNKQSEEEDADNEYETVFSGDGRGERTRTKLRGRRERENRYQWKRGQISLGKRTCQWHRVTYISGCGYRCHWEEGTDIGETYRYLGKGADISGKVGKCHWMRGKISNSFLSFL